jgi:hypothetical protein
MNGTSPADTSTNISNWYTDYCAAKPDKACMVRFPSPLFQSFPAIDNYPPYSSLKPVLLTT